MQVDASTALAQFCVRSRPLACLFQIPFKAFLTRLIWNIKVDDNVVLRHLDIMEPRRVQSRQGCFHIVPFL